MPCENHGKREELLAAAAGPERARMKQLVFSLTPRCNGHALGELQMGTRCSPCTWKTHKGHRKNSRLYILIHCVTEGYFHANV